MPDKLLEERRKIKRRHLVYYLKVFDVDTDLLLGHLVDITAEGMMMVREEPLEEGRVFQLRLELPQQVLMKDTLNFSAECRWCEKDVNPDLHKSGFQFLSISDKDQSVIDNLVRRHAFQD
jgi:c-di-GMP-binding flagellar brake protein YcgR